MVVALIKHAAGWNLAFWVTNTNHKKTCYVSNVSWQHNAALKTNFADSQNSMVGIKPGDDQQTHLKCSGYAEFWYIFFL